MSTHQPEPLGVEFARALAAKDSSRMLDLMHPEIDFRGLTPRRSWEANDRDEVMSVLLRHWFEDSDKIEALERVEHDTFADRHRVGYRFSVNNPDGRFLVEQQAYLAARDGRIGWMRVVCSGFRPAAAPGDGEDVIDAAHAALREPGGLSSTAAARVSSDVGAVVAHARVLGEPSSWDPALKYASTALAVIDSVWSIGVRYQGVRNVLDRYRVLRASQRANPEGDTPADLVRVIDGLGGPEAFAEAMQNRQRTSTRGGILKAEAVLQEAQILAEECIASPEDLLDADVQKLEAVRRRWMSVPGQGSGISLEYFLMLNGMPGVKADRMVRRFVANALGLPNELAVSAEEAGALVRAATHQLGGDERILDYAIWRYESGQ